MIIALAEKDNCRLYKAWQYLMRTRFHVIEAENRVDLTTLEPRRDEGMSNISCPPIIDLVTPETVPVVDLSTPETDQLIPPVVDLSTPEPDQLVAPVVDLSTPEPEQLVPALSVSARALAMSQCRPLGLQLLTPDLRRCLLNLRSKAKSHHCWGGISLYHAFRTPIPSEMVLCRRDTLAQGCHGQLC
jgi:hypothetical protein